MTENITRIADLRVGDIVRLEGGSWGSHPAGGEELAVEALISDEEARVEGSWYIYDGPRADWPFVFVRRPGDESTEEAENTPAVPEGLVFERYHESMLPMIETLSKAADDAGYCQEYDRMARSIGAPTRAEVRRIVQERDGRQYRVSIPVTVHIPVEVTAHSEQEARELAMNTRLPGVGEDVSTRDASSNSWVGLRQAVAHIASREAGYPRHGELTYEGVSSYVVREI